MLPPLRYVNTERDYEGDYQQATRPQQGRTAAGGCKPRHGRDDKKRERGFSGLNISHTRKAEARANEKTLQQPAPLQLNPPRATGVGANQQ